MYITFEIDLKIIYIFIKNIRFKYYLSQKKYNIYLNGYLGLLGYNLGYKREGEAILF
jgi:hypothetical protein